MNTNSRWRRTLPQCRQLHHLHICQQGKKCMRRGLNWSNIHLGTAKPCNQSGFIGHNCFQSYSPACRMLALYLQLRLSSTCWQGKGCIWASRKRSSVLLDTALRYGHFEHTKPPEPGPEGKYVKTHVCAGRCLSAASCITCVFTSRARVAGGQA